MIKTKQLTTSRLKKLPASAIQK